MTTLSSWLLTQPWRLDQVFQGRDLGLGMARCMPQLGTIKQTNSQGDGPLPHLFKKQLGKTFVQHIPYLWPGTYSINPSGDLQSQRRPKHVTPACCCALQSTLLGKGWLLAATLSWVSLSICPHDRIWQSHHISLLVVLLHFVRTGVCIQASHGTSPCSPTPASIGCLT